LTEAPALDRSARMSLPAILIYSLGGLPTSALGIAVLVYLSPYFASHLGVPLMAVSGAFVIVRVIDFFVDPLLGMVMDRTRTPIGRYRAWQIIGAPILMLAAYKLFMAPYGIGETYLVGWLLVMYLSTSILDLSRSAWSATLATQYHERSRVFGVLAAVGVLGPVAVLAIPVIAASIHPHETSSVPLMGWFVLVLTPLTIGLASTLTREKVNVDLHSSRFPWRDYLELVRRPALLRLFLGQAAVSLGPNWMSAMYIFFFTQSRGFTAAQASSLLIVYVLAGVAGAPATGYLARKIGKHRALMVTTTAFSLGLCTVMMFPRGNVLAALPMMFWCGFMGSGFGLMIGAMAADFGDQVRLEQGKERISLIYAMLTFATKLAGAISIGLTYWALRAVGFHPAEGAVNSASAIHGLEAIFLIGPIFFVMAGGLCFIGWKLDHIRHGEIRSALEARDAELEASRMVHPINVEAIVELTHRAESG
jgi:glycoside/pentoside/hexuronide:cation symporter, GPH family